MNPPDQKSIRVLTRSYPVLSPPSLGVQHAVASRRALAAAPSLLYLSSLLSLSPPAQPSAKSHR